MVTPVEVFLLARDVLLPLNTLESAARSCVSRAYYGAFLSARRVCGERDRQVVHIARWQTGLFPVPPLGIGKLATAST